MIKSKKLISAILLFLFLVTLTFASVISIISQDIITANFKDNNFLLSTIDKSLSINFVENSDEALLKNSGYIGTLEKTKESKLIEQVDIFMFNADNNAISTADLTFDSIDYGMIEDEARILSTQTNDPKKIENYCRCVAYINYNGHNRAKIDLKVTKTFVDGSLGVAPYAGLWDLRSDMVISNIDYGTSKHYIEAAAPLIVISTDLLDVTQPETNANNATLSISSSMTNSFQIQAGIQYDNRVPNLQVGGTYEFTYGKTTTHSFNKYSFSSVTTAYPDYNLWGNTLNGAKYKVVNNEKEYILNYQLVQRVGYFDIDSTPDDLFAFIGIGGLKIDGKGFAPNLLIGDLEASENVNDGNLFGIFMGWKSDNSAHAYAANINGFSNNMIMDYSSSNLPADVWTHTYGYGF